MADTPTGQGTAGSTDLVTQLQGVTRQLSVANQNMLNLITAVQEIAFPVKSYTVATLPSSPSFGMLAAVSDAASGLAWGSAVGSGGHSTPYLCWWNNTQWSVFAK